MRVVLVTGTVGIGKSTVGHAVARRAAERGGSAAFLDLDGLSRLWPAPAGDPFRTELVLANLAALLANYEAAGADLWCWPGQSRAPRISPIWRQRQVGRSPLSVWWRLPQSLPID